MNFKKNNRNDDSRQETVKAAEVEATTTATQKEVLVKTLGRHARQRLDEERSKRREIQRLPDDDAAAAAAAVAKAGARGRGTLVVEPLLKKKKKPTAPRKRKQRIDREDGQNEEQEEVQARVDRWMPDVSHLNNSTLQEFNTTTTHIMSTVVQLHGLPVGTTSAAIRRFFAGLDPRRILLLLPHTTKASTSIRIPELDANYDKPPRKGGLRVERYDWERLRVLVNFESAPMASLAVQRSGEVMQVLKNNGTHCQQQDDKEEGACVAVTPVNKAMATYLIKHLAVDAIPRVPLDQTVQGFRAKLDPIVSAILWDAVIHELHWNASALSQTQSQSQSQPQASAFCSLQLRPRHWTRARNPRSKESQYELIQQWQDYRTALAHQVDRLLFLLVKEGHPAAAGQRLLLHDPALLMLPNNNCNNPCWTLTLRCVDVLRLEMERVNHAVTVAERWKRLVATRGSLGAVD